MFLHCFLKERLANEKIAKTMYRSLEEIKTFSFDVKVRGNIRHRKHSYNTYVGKAVQLGHRMVQLLRLTFIFKGESQLHLPIFYFIC